MRRRLLLVIGVSLSLLGLWACLRDDQVATTAAAVPAAAATPPRADDEAQGRARPEVPGTPEVLARPSCVGDLLAIDRATSFDGVRSALARGLAGDELIAAYLRDRVAELVGKSAERALEIVAWAAGATDVDAGVLLAGLAQSDGAKDPRVAAALLALGGDRAVTNGVRRAALDALRTQPALDAAGRGQLKDLALAADEGALGWNAARALGAVMNETERAAGDVAPYRDALQDVATTSADPAVRAIALEAPMHADSILPRAKIDAMVDVMLGEPDRDVRELAAFQLGLTDSPRDALEAFRRAFEQEYDECVRWAIVRFAVRAAGADALPLLEHFARIDPAFVLDLQDFRALFAAGYVDFEQIWLNKPERHACVADHGENEGEVVQ